MMLPTRIPLSFAVARRTRVQKMLDADWVAPKSGQRKLGRVRALDDRLTGSIPAAAVITISARFVIELAHD